MELNFGLFEVVLEDVALEVLAVGVHTLAALGFD